MKSGFGYEILILFGMWYGNGHTHTHTKVIDARSNGRFEGTAPEPRPSLSSGHMISARNVPYMTLLNPETKIMLSKHQIQEGRWDIM